MKHLLQPMAAAAACLALVAHAADIPSRTDRTSWQDAIRFLALTGPQLDALRTLRTAFNREMTALETQARALQGSSANLTRERGLVCQKAQQIDADFRARSQGQLTADQRTRLDQLNQAFLMLPVIDSVQATGLLPDRQNLPPPGMSQGQIEVAQRWQRVLAAPLPGCDATTLRDEVGLEQGQTDRAPKLK